MSHFSAAINVSVVTTSCKFPILVPRTVIAFRSCTSTLRTTSEKTNFVPVESNELAFILHTSGTTAKPKGTVQPHGSYQVYIHSMGKWVYSMSDRDELRGEVAAAFVVLKAGYAPTGQLKKELRELVQKSLGKIVVVDDIDFVDMLPKTRSGKIMRRLIKAVISGQPLGDYSTIEDEESIEEIKKGAEALIAGLNKES
jgi:acyl-coenzyme A synthetase/AMP-(fatty) acid ligase